MTERQIDDAIDGAVRDIMHVDADPAFRARVLAKIDERPKRFPWWRFAAATAAVVALALTFLLPRRGGDVQAPVLSRSVPIPAPAVEPRRPTVPASNAARPMVAPRSAGGRLAQPGLTHVVPRGTLVATVADAAPPGALDQPGALDPLGVIDPIGVAPIAQAPIGPAAIVVAPLAPITEMRIAPFGPRIERD